jgi:uncharacterized membrane protein YhaH (DUF805 family)
MADVFISYAREDRPRAEHVANALTALGLECFWDTDIPPGHTWADYIEGKLDQSRSVIVLWSQHSTSSQWVREEARMGRDKSKLIPAILDGTPPPFGFGEVQAADLSTWRGEHDHPEWRRLAHAVYSAARGGEPPPAAPQQTQSRFSAGAAQPAAGAPSPLDYVRKCLRLYFDGKGRARRSEYGWFFVFAFAVGVAAGVLDILLFGIDPYTGAANSYVLTILAGLGLVAPAVSAASRRAHDLGQSGWLAALTAVPYIGLVAALAFIFIPGQAGPNQYGPDPKTS